MATAFTNPLDIPKTYYKAIGEVIARFNLLDQQLMGAIACILKITNKKQRRIAFMRVSIRPKLATLGALSFHWSPTPEIKAELSAVVKEALRLVKWRNRLAHGIWGYSQNRKKLHLIFADEGKDLYLPKSVPLKSADVLHLAAAVRTLTKRVWIVVRDLENYARA